MDFNKTIAYRDLWKYDLSLPYVTQGQVSFLGWGEFVGEIAFDDEKVYFKGRIA